MKTEEHKKLSKRAVIRRLRAFKKCAESIEGYDQETKAIALKATKEIYGIQ